MGFELWAQIGADGFCPAPISLTVCFRQRQAPHFYIDVVGNASDFGNEVYAETLPDVMELLALWAPMVQPTSIAELIRRDVDQAPKQPLVVPVLAARLALAQLLGELLQQRHPPGRARSRSCTPHQPHERSSGC